MEFQTDFIDIPYNLTTKHKLDLLTYRKVLPYLWNPGKEKNRMLGRL